MMKVICGLVGVILMIFLAIKQPILFFVYLGLMCLLNAIYSIKEENNIPMAVFDVILIFIFVKIVQAIIK